MDIAARTLLFTALAGLVGLASARILLRSGSPRPGTSPAGDTPRTPGGADPGSATPGRAPTLAGVGLSLLGLAAALLLGWAQFAAFRDPFAPWQEDAAVLLQTAWGRRWLLLLGGFGISAATFAIPRARVLGWALAPILALYPATSGHAAAVEGWAPVTMAMDWIHILASGAWLGALGVLAWIGRPGGDGPVPLVRVLPAFSLQARVAVSLIVVTGSAAAVIHVGSVAALWNTLYGRILVGKVGVVGLLLLTGLFNWRVLSRDAVSLEGGARLVRSARLEVALGIAVLVLSAWITGTAPPG